MSMPAEAHIQIQIKREHLSSVLLKNWNERSRSMKCVQGVIIIFDMIMLQYTISSSIRRGNFSKPEGCRTRPLLFNLFNMTSRGPPNFVELHRCMGFDVGYAVNYRCVSTTSTHLNITLGSTQVHIVYTSVCDEMCLRGWGALDKMCTRSHGFRRLLLLTMVLLAYYPVGNITAGIILQYCIFVL